MMQVGCNRQLDMIDSNSRKFDIKDLLDRKYNDKHNSLLFMTISTIFLKHDDLLTIEGIIYDLISLACEGEHFNVDIKGLIRLLWRMLS